MRQALLSELLLREYIRDLINEDSGLGSFAGDYAGVDVGAGNAADAGTWGGSPIKGDLFKAFVEPFTDVLKTAVAETKMITRTVATLLHVSFKVLVTTFIPIAGANYYEIFEQEKNDLAKIRDQYRDVYERTDAALNSDDAKFFTFLAAPQAFLGKEIAKKAPGVLKETLSVISGGYSDDIIDGVLEGSSDIKREALMLAFGISEEGRKRVGAALRKSSNSKKSRRDPDSFDWSSMGESVIYEEKQDNAEFSKKDAEKEAKNLLEKIIQSDGFKKALQKNPAISDVSDEVIELKKSTLDEIYDQATTIAKKFTSIENIEAYLQKSKGKSKAADMNKVKAELQKIKNLKTEEKKKALQILVSGVKDASKNFAIKELEKNSKELKDKGLPADHELMKDYQTTIQKVKAL